MSNTATRTNTQPAELMSHSLVTRTAQRFGVDAGKLVSTLKATCFKVKDGEATNEQMLALLVVAEQYKLNPFTRELFAFPDKQNGIVPVVSVDGWTRIINENPMLDGIKFVYADDMKKMDEDAQDCPVWCEVHIKRKDRSDPIIIREYLDEVYRPAFTGKGQNGPYKIKGPWQTHTKRFMRHKTLIQGSRIAFGFAGIYDQDEAERIVEGITIDAEPQRGKPVVQQPQSKSKVAVAEVAEAVEGVLEVAGTITARSEELQARANLMADLAAKADEGAEALRATWASMSQGARDLIGDEDYNRILKIAEKANAQH